MASGGGVIGGPNLNSGIMVPSLGGGPPATVPAAPSDSYYILWSADARLPNAIVFAGPTIDGTTAPANTAYFWGDTTVSPKVLKYYDAGTAAWIQFNGASSSAWLNGSGNPSGGLGSNGDYYIDVGGGATNGKLWQKQSGTWVYLTTIAGAPGNSLNPLGAWASGTTYNALDLVTYAGMPYVAVVSSTGVTPGTDPTKWMLLINLSISATVDFFSFQNYS